MTVHAKKTISQVHQTSISMSNSSAKLILVRHGQSTYNKQNRFTGWKNPSLSAQGKIEAIEAGLKLKSIKIDIAYTSTLLRARQTLKLMLKMMKATKIPIVISENLNERSYGELEGLNKTETTAKYGIIKVQRWRRSYDIRPPGGESLKDTAARVITYFESEISPQIKSGKTVLVVAHGNSLRALIMYIEKLNPAEIIAIEIPTGVPRIYQWQTDSGWV